jgi:hypothetical protein
MTPLLRVIVGAVDQVGGSEASNGSGHEGEEQGRVTGPDEESSHARRLQRNFPPLRFISPILSTLAGVCVLSTCSARRKGGVLNSPVVPAPGAQVVFWTSGDPDDDTLAATFALAPEGTETWTDLAIETAESHVQFEVGHLPEGRYRSRLTVRELAPRPTAQRLAHVFETDVLVVDRTPPEVLSAAVEQPDDGIRDSRRETFVAEFTAPRAAGATSVEILLYDRTGNSASRRLPLQ